MANSNRLLRFAGAALAVLLASTSLAQVGTNVDTLRGLSETWTVESTFQKALAERQARILGLPIRQEFRDGTTIELMRFEYGQPVYNTTFNVNAAISTATNLVHPTGGQGFALTGQGMIMGIWDGGRVRPNHQEFAGGRAISKDGASNNNHATHVGGTMAAGGAVGSARGMAYQGILHSYNWNNDNAQMAAEAADGLLISNHSYGPAAGWRSSGGTWYWYGDPSISQTKDWKFGFYGTAARNWDIIAFNAPYYLIVNAAGNSRNTGPQNQPTGFYWNGNNWVANQVVRDINGAPQGYDTLPGYSMAKNIMTVGAVNNVTGGYSGPQSVVMSSFSSWGPTDDGRIKPDIVANGVQLYSPVANNNSAYATYSGTSMASPNASGSLILLQQHHQNLFAGQRMRAATLKGLAIHTADECGPNPGPDYAFGWGLLNTLRGAQTITKASTVDTVLTESVLTNGGEYWMVVYCTGTEDLRATLCWTDPPGTVSNPALNDTTPKLVNDLDLRITRFDGTTFFPWRLNVNNPSAAATKGDNVVDTVEMVDVDQTLAGYYIIRVTHKGNLSGGSQAFSLIVTGQSPIAPSSTSGSRSG